MRTIGHDFFLSSPLAFSASFMLSPWALDDSVGCRDTPREFLAR
jgi:hypothetical protein